MQLQEEYNQWRRVQADAAIAQQFSKESLTRRLRQISSRLRRDERLSAMLDRLTPGQTHLELMKELRREVVQELALPSIAEWKLANPQPSLF